MLDNLDAYKAGEKLPHIITKPFMETFTVGLGGSGMTLAVVVILVFFMKKKQYKDIGRLALEIWSIQCERTRNLWSANRFERNNFDSLGACTISCYNVELLSDGRRNCSSANRCVCAMDGTDYR